MVLLRLRFVALVAVVSAAGGSLLMFYLGAAKTVKAYRIYFLGEPLTVDPAPPDRGTRVERVGRRDREFLSSFRNLRGYQS